MAGTDLTLKVKDEFSPVLLRITNRLDTIEELLQANREDLADALERMIEAERK